jgi:eukaryotic-like serine/threonine-protein kinase
MALGGMSTAPARLGRYELLARLATGGMGEIFLARLEGAAGFEKLYVVKRILPHLADDARFRAMLITEARLASKLAHANICQVYELGETDGQLYIVMEYLEGMTLLPLLRKASKEQAQLDFGLVGGVIQQVADALHYAHELRDRDRGNDPLGIVHRDVTPSNIFLTDAGVAKVLDFGIAKVKDASANTQTGTVKGKYAYMAPEQLRGISIDRRVDVFALGVIAYEMLALRRLFQRKTDYLTFRAVMEQPIPDVRRYRADVPDALAEHLLKALDRDPAKRFDTARQLGTALIDAMASLKRPWTQGEIGDFVRSQFSGELGKRSEQVQSAIHRKPIDGSPPGRTTMPLIAQEGDDATEIDDLDDDEFPPVESTVSEPSSDLKRVLREHPPQDFAGSTPPPFSGDPTTASGYQLTPLQQGPRRSLVWPILAIAMIGIAGAALFLVWKQMQQQQPPSVVNITSESVTPPVATTPPPGSAAPTGSAAPVVDNGSAAVKAPPTKPPTTPPPSTGPKRSAYDAAIRAHQARVAQCARDHASTPAPGNAKVVIDVTTDGKARRISLEPPELDASPLGACIKNVLSAAKYPTAADEVRVSVPLKAT